MRNSKGFVASYKEENDVVRILRKAAVFVGLGSMGTFVGEVERLLVRASCCREYEIGKNLGNHFS